MNFNPYIDSTNYSKRNSTILNIFILSLLATHIYFIIANLITRGDALTSIAYLNYIDTFMDFLNPFSWLQYEDAPYDNLFSVYPPFALLIVKLFLTLSPNQDVYYYSNFYLNNFEESVYIYMLFCVICISFVAVILYSYCKKKTNKPVAMLLSLLTVFSLPFLCCYERGNLIIVAFLFTLLFLTGYQSDKKIIRELSYICLAAAAAIKIYPALFGLLILKEKRYKEAIHCVIYGLLFFLVPCFFFGGPKIFIQLFENIKMVGQHYTEQGSRLRFNILSMIDTLFETIGFPTISKTIFGKIIWLFTAFLLIFNGFTNKVHWKSVLSLALFCVVIPSFSWMYALIFLAIGEILFLTDTKKHEKTDYIYFVFFIILSWQFTPLYNVVFLDVTRYEIISLYAFIEIISTLLFTFFVCTECIVSTIKYIRKGKESKIHERK